MLRRGFISAILLTGMFSVAYGDEPMQSETRMLTVGQGVELATRVTGKPERGTILLAMGATASMVWWPQSLVTGLAEGGYQIIQFDHRDTGQSTTNLPGDVRYDVSDLASDLIAILDGYEVPAAHLVGMSLGGYLSQIVAQTHPDRVRSLTLIASEPLGVTYQGEGIAPDIVQHFATMADLDWADHTAVARFLLKIAELSAGSAAPFDRVAASGRVETELQRTSSMQSAFNHAMMVGELGPEFNAARLDLPVLVIHGTQDPVISLAAAQASAAAIAKAEMLLLPGRGHELLEMDVPAMLEAILTLTARAAASR